MAKSKQNFVVKSVLKEAISKGKCHSASDVTEAVNGLVAWYVQQAVKRARANGRKTVRGHDFCIE